MKYYGKKLKVDVHDVDFNGIARASMLMRYIQSSAQSQLTDNGMSYDNLKSINRAFILSRIKLEFTKAVMSDDELIAETFPCESRGFTFLRCYRLLKDGQIIGRAVSAWALVNTENHSLVRVNDFELGLNTYTPLDIPLSRIVIPKELIQVGSYFVSYSDVDRNGHMNNTRYPDLYANFLPLEGRRIESITISYLNEAPAKDTLDVYCANQGDSYYFRTIRSDGKINTEAEIHLADI